MVVALLPYLLASLAILADALVTYRSFGPGWVGIEPHPWLHRVCHGNYPSKWGAWQWLAFCGYWALLTASVWLMPGQWGFVWAGMCFAWCMNGAVNGYRRLRRGRLGRVW